LTENGKFDLIVIGAGPGGYTAANRAGQLGLSVALVEKDEPGGTCLNRGCIPTKALLHAAGIFAEQKKHAGWFKNPFNAENPAVPDFQAIASYRDRTVDTLRDGLVRTFKQNHVTLIRGTAKIHAVSENGVSVDVSGIGILEAKNVILAAGSRASKIPVPGAESEHVLTSDGMLTMNSLPGSVVIVGGGVIGCEFACFLNEFGTKVTMVEALPRILNNLDREISQNLKMILKKRGVEIFTDRKVLSMSTCPSGETECRFLENKDGAKEEICAADYVLISAGRKTEPDILLDENAVSLGLSLKTERGRIIVDENFRTSLDHVYAIGDLIPGIQLAHSAEAEGRYAALYIASGKKDVCDLSLIPSCVYTSPEIACVGMTEEEAEASGIETVTGKAIMGANAKSVITEEERGFMKFTADTKDKRLIGAQFMCARASDMIGEAAVAVANRLTVSDCLKSVRAHPTYEEAMTDALEKMI